jgi:hypothetical protein
VQTQEAVPPEGGAFSGWLKDATFSNTGMKKRSLPCRWAWWTFFPVRPDLRGRTSALQPSAERIKRNRQSVYSISEPRQGLFKNWVGYRKKVTSAPGSVLAFDTCPVGMNFDYLKPQIAPSDYLTEHTSQHLSEHTWIHLAEHLVPGLVELREEIAELLQHGKEIPAEKLAELRHKKAEAMRLRFGGAE